MDNHIELLREAVGLAASQLASPDGRPFGALVTRHGKVVSRAHNEAVLAHDATAHAEILAIRRACHALGSHVIADTVLYTSAYPCAMCLAAVYWAGIGKVYYAADAKQVADAGFADARIRELVLEGNGSRAGAVCTKIDIAEAMHPFELWKRRSSNP